jgi:hypothetical protein
LALPKRRWKERPKDQLDADISRRGNPLQLTAAERAASKDRRKNRNIEGKRKAAKKKESTENKN